MKTIRRFFYIFFQKFVLLLTVLIGSVVILSPSIVHAADGDFVWAKGMGGTSGNDRGNDIFVDASGNVYTTGYFQGTVDFDPGPGTVELTSTVNSRDIFITKLNSGGNLVWAKRIGGVSSDEGWGIVADSAGNVYTTGYFLGTVDFNPGAGTASRTSTGNSDIFISKLDSDGNFVGAWVMGGTAADYGYGTFVDSTGNIYTTGYFQNTVDFDPGAGTFNLSSVGVADIFICKLDSNGSFVWARSIGGAAADVGLGISLYSSGNIYITGYFQDTVDFDPGTGTSNLTSAGSYDIFISKLDINGNFVWAKAMGGLSDDRGQAVSVDTLGNVYTTGWFNLTADFDPGAGTALLTSTGIASDIFISKLDSGGNYIWARAMGGSSSADIGYGIAIDASGNIYTTGSFQGADVDFDPGAGTFNLTSAGNEDIFISKLNSSGIFVWAKAMGGPSTDYGYDIAVTSSGAVHTTGYFQGTADFDPGPGTFSLVSAGFEDIFISKLAGPDPVIDTTFPWAMFLPAILGNAQAQP